MLKLVKEWLKMRSLVFKVSVSVFLCFFVGVVILLGIVTERSERIIKEQIIEHGVHTTKAAMENISHLVQETEQSVRSLRNTMNNLDYNDVEVIEIALKSTIKAIHNSGLNLSHAVIYTFSSQNSESGTFYTAFANNGDISFKSENINDFGKKFPWFKDVDKEDKIFWSEPYISPNSPKQNMVITCVLPFKFQNSKVFNGIVSISVDLQDIQKYIANSPFRDNGALVLLSKKGLYITHPNPEINLKTTIFELAEKLKHPTLFQIGQDVLSGKSGYEQMPFSSVYNAPTVFFYTPIPYFGWGLCLIYSRAALFKPVYDLQVTIIISSVIGILILLFLLNRICYYSLLPLQRLTAMAKQYGSGNFSTKVSPDIVSGGEIGTLFSAFRNMSVNLTRYIAKEKKNAMEEQKKLSELEIAQQIQRAALRTDFTKHKAFDIYAQMIPAQLIGGDFYDYFFLNEHKIALLIADVAGKGISAAFYMMRAKEVIKQMAMRTCSVGQIFEQVNNILCKGNKACMFMTAFLAVVDLKSGKTEYVNAGHLSPILMSETKCRLITSKQNIALGAIEQVKYKAEKIKLEPNSGILIYTDGVTEAENKDGDFYGEGRLLKILQTKRTHPEEIIKDVIADIQKFADRAPQSDDITMLSFIYRG